MIGDWVSYIPEIEIGEDSYLGEPRYTQVDIPTLQRMEDLIFTPIPLTPEILEKNGLKDWCEHSTIVRSVNVLVEDNTNLCIQEIKGQDSMFVQISHCGAGSFEFRKHLKYVHELQRALRLCGLNELADNFKV